MTSDLKNFLEKNSEIETFDGAINVSEHNTKVVNFVLDLVEKEVEKRIDNLKNGPVTDMLGDDLIRVGEIDSLKNVSTIIDNLRV